jgi:hypothetical protein
MGGERDPGRPRRGLEGYRLEAWYELPVWPAWLRYVYDRHQEFRDIDRRVLSQTLEAQSWLTQRIRARAWYEQRDERLDTAGRREQHDDVVAELVAEEGGSRVRVQAGLLDVHSPAERAAGALEVATRIGSRLQAVARATFIGGAPDTRRSLFAELQYWHLPQFDLALGYGPDWIGDAADPLRDGDLVTSGDAQDRVRLRFRGWF